MTPTLYHDNDPKVCAWLRNLVASGRLPAGHVECGDIRTLDPAACAPTTHLFAGIGGWPLALRLAGWPGDRPVWTGSCPCQPYSSAGQGKGDADPRNLWPAMRRFVSECQPATVFGEQVAGALGWAWFAGVRVDLETLGYAVGASGLCAYAVGSPHERLRVFWVAHAASNGREGLQRSTATQVSQDGSPQALDAWHGTGSPFEHWQKLLAEPHVMRVDDGISSTVDIRPRLHAYGNAIVPQAAAAFIRAFLDCERDAVTASK